ncbi:EAL domain-containing protein [Flexibacterium corallicola]|uniref:EAL domain-containing protein n=1 Tax=Flexibacterium corallicola TaxID=3037259 RepID=UPI00286F4F96|nr:EAL domain-containing protein [Pseudovibrio sp. M1P-2-3]
MKLQENQNVKQVQARGWNMLLRLFLSGFIAPATLAFFCYFFLSPLVVLNDEVLMWLGGLAIVSGSVACFAGLKDRAALKAFARSGDEENEFTFFQRIRGSSRNLEEARQGLNNLVARFRSEQHEALRKLSVDEKTGLMEPALFFATGKKLLAEFDGYKGECHLIALDLFEGLQGATGYSYENIEGVLGSAARVIGEQLEQLGFQNMATQPDQLHGTMSSLSEKHSAIAYVARPVTHEFLLLVFDGAGREALHALPKNLLHSLKLALASEYPELQLEPRVGRAKAEAVSLAKANECFSELLQKAQVALSLTKFTGSTASISKSDLNLRHNASQMARLQELDAALEAKQFCVFYQPLVRGSTGQVCGVEALVRWPRTKTQIIGPSDFLPLLEGSERMEQLGAIVLEKVCADAKVIRETFKSTRIAVNVSIGELMATNFSETVLTTLERFDLAPDILELELTETQCLGDADAGLQQIEKLSKAGIRFALDDFGTCYSGLARLAELPIDTIKIDRCFVENIQGDTRRQAILSATASLAKETGTRVVAEGVETLEQALSARDCGVDMLQGYYFSGPMPLDTLLSWGETWAGEGQRGFMEKFNQSKELV